GLENDALDADLSPARSEAAAVLLRSVSSPGLVRELRRHLRRRASHPDVGRALSLLNAWEDLVADPGARAGLLAGLSGAADLGSSLAGAPASDDSSLAASVSSPSAGRPLAAAATGRTGVRVLIPLLVVRPLAAYQLRPNNLAPPGRAPPHPFLSSRSLPPAQQRPSRSTRPETDRTAGPAFSRHPRPVLARSQAESRFPFQDRREEGTA
ncbi:MAG: hypothetical protein WC943_17110, partial [Elusimicrobiota bacterium]